MSHRLRSRQMKAHSVRNVDLRGANRRKRISDIGRLATLIIELSSGWKIMKRPRKGISKALYGDMIIKSESVVTRQQDTFSFELVCHGDNGMRTRKFRKVTGERKAFNINLRTSPWSQMMDPSEIADNGRFSTRAASVLGSTQRVAFHLVISF